MQLQFLQELENLSLDGEAFLAQFLEFLLDRSLSGDTRFEPLIPTVAQVLDLKLPITTVTSSFALLQAHLRQNKIGLGSFTNSTWQPNPDKNIKPFVTKTEEVKISPPTKTETGKKTDKTESNSDPNSSSNTTQAESIEPSISITTEAAPKTAEINSQNSTPKVSLSQVHTILIRRIAASSHTQLKLLMSDLSIANIDLQSYTGILTLSSGALLNFLKTKKSLTWLAEVLQEEFGWQLELSAQQRESKTILFESDELLPVHKTNYSPQNLPKKPALQATSEPNLPVKTEISKEKDVSEPKEDTKSNSVEYSVFWPNGGTLPYNLAGLPTITEIPEPPSLDWEDLVADFEME